MYELIGQQSTLNDAIKKDLKNFSSLEDATQRKATTNLKHVIQQCSIFQDSQYAIHWMVLEAISRN